MSVISITAPQFTVDDERLEREMLTEEEYIASQHDIYGTDEFCETGDMLREGPVELERAIQEIPMEEKEAYLEASERVPEIVEAESNYIMFLRSENYNVWVSVHVRISYFSIFALFGEQ